MKTISKLRMSSTVLLSLCTSSVFAGVDVPPVQVSEPSVFALLAAGAVVVLYAVKRRKK